MDVGRCWSGVDANGGVIADTGVDGVMEVLEKMQVLERMQAPDKMQVLGILDAGTGQGASTRADKM